MKFECNINMDNDAFAQEPHLELCRALREIAHNVRDNDDVVRSATVRDINGNRIGTWKIKGE